jgi:enoyl-CoA hydratase/carnithine racemase
MDIAYDDLVLQKREDDIVILTLNNPQRRNAFGFSMREVFLRHLMALQQDPECRAIVVTGAGGQFCSGGDLNEMKQRPFLESRLRLDLPTRIFKLLVTGAKPVITAAEGNIAGAGISLVAASDYAIAASDSAFSCSFIKMGLIPDVGGLWSIQRRVGRRRAIEICGLGERFDASAAMEMQLINAVSPPGEALTQAIAVARRFARVPPVAMALLKSALATGADTLDQAINTEINLQGLLFASEDYDEAIQAFRGKREPDFKGR